MKSMTIFVTWARKCKLRNCNPQNHPIQNHTECLNVDLKANTTTPHYNIKRKRLSWNVACPWYKIIEYPAH